MNALIPYFDIPVWHIGPLPVGIFGLFAALGIYTAAELVVRHARRQGLSVAPLEEFAPWGVGVGLVAGHWVHLFFYHPEELSKSAWQIFKIWDGLSSFGGLLGGILAAVVYFQVRRVSFRTYADAYALGVAPGWAIARIGCFLVHDHPGVRSDFFLAVRFPGGSRHDLGLYDALVLFSLSAVLYALRDKAVLQGRLLPLLALLYAPIRLGLDFLRATDTAYVDARYAGLTPAQYGCILLIGYGIWGMLSAKPSSASPRPAQTQ